MMLTYSVQYSMLLFYDKFRDVTCVAFWTVIEVAYRSRILTLTCFVLLRYLCGFSFCFFLSFSFSMLLFYDKLRVIKLNIQLFMFVFV